MKNILLTLLFILFSFFAQAQKGTTTFSISYGEGKGQIRGIIGMAKKFDSTSEGAVNFFDFNYTIGKRKHSAIETGVSLMKHNFTYSILDTRSFTTTITPRSIYALIVPLKLRTDILKYFFMSGGLLGHINIGDGGIESLGIESSLGIGLGGGIQYVHKEKYGIFVYPQVNVHNIGYGLLEHHTSFGISYRLGKN